MWRTLLGTMLLIGLGLVLPKAAPVCAAEPAVSLPKATPDRLPLWRGFNLLEKFNRARNTGGFRESDFQIIHQLGFNFVRLPMDYRTWIVDDDWTRFDEQSLREIDQAVAWGEQYGIHVMLNFHRAPGYTVARPPERLSLWTDAEAQRVCAMHWAMFAKRYRGIPNERLELQSDERAGADRARGLSACDQADRRGDPRGRSRSADRLGRTRLGPAADPGTGRLESGPGDSRLLADGCLALPGQLGLGRRPVSDARLAEGAGVRNAVRAEQTRDEARIDRTADHPRTVPAEERPCAST
jgi:hypothetical protein